MQIQSTHPVQIKKSFGFRGGERERGFICIGKLKCRATQIRTSYYHGERLFLERPLGRDQIRIREVRCEATTNDSKNNYSGGSTTNYSKNNYSGGLWGKITKYLNAFYLFCRPHTIFGTVMGITSVSLLPVKGISDISPIFFKALLQALVPAVFMNIYVVGLNQLFDIEIDKVNKPNLPLASGELSMKVGIILVIAFLLMSLSMGIKSQSPPLLAALIISFILGSAYSIDLPLLRWKRHAFLSALCILCVRAILVQLAFFAHMQVYVLKRPLSFTISVIFATVFMCFFSSVIAMFKDIPDINGDKIFGIESFSVRLGQKRVFWLCIALLLIAYGFAILLGAFSAKLHLRLVNVIGHFVMAYILWLRACYLDVQNKSSVTSFYMFIWKLFYAEYILIPFMQ